MNIDQHKRRLLAKEQELLSHINRAGASARESDNESVGDAGDESINNERKEELLWQVDAELTVLNEVREALRRIDNGTFGKCLIDGETIEEKRLKAMPWAPYCLKHQQLLEESAPRRMPTL